MKDCSFQMEKIIGEKGLILWIPKTPNKKKIIKALKSELEFIENSLVITTKDDITPLLHQAIKHFGAYPNRILRFYKCPNHECDGEVNMSWENPAVAIESFMYRYNP